MASETVTIYCYDQGSALLDGVLIRVFDSTGATFITEGITGSVISGAVEFTLTGDNPPEQYTIRMSKIGVSFTGELGDENKSPQSITIYSPASASPTGTNDFEVSGVVATLPSATDPRLCRCSGYVVNYSGQPLADVTIRIEGIKSPLIVDDILVWGNSLNATTNSDGYVEVDLYREGEYKAMIAGLEDEYRPIYVPDRSSFNINHLLFTVVDSVTYSPASVSVAEDAEQDVTVTVVASDLRTLEGAASEDVTYTVADENVASVEVAEDKLVVRGIAAGSTTVTATRKDTTIVQLPEATITQTPLAITVT